MANNDSMAGTLIKAVPVPEKEIGIDRKNTLA